MNAPEGMTKTLANNIEALAARRRREEADAPWSDRVAAQITCFAGSMRFVFLHLAFFGAWIAINLGAVPGVRPFDPSFVVLAMEASVEAIFLSTFVLISQNRQAAQADRRADLDLHISLLTEHELSKLTELVARIAHKVGVDADNPDLDEIREDVEPGKVLDALEREHPTG
jgi:uncharacterized membrane protein